VRHASNETRLTSDDRIVRASWPDRSGISFELPCLRVERLGSHRVVIDAGEMALAIGNGPKHYQGFPPSLRRSRIEILPIGYRNISRRLRCIETTIAFDIFWMIAAGSASRR
jgi:hypothetical protein